MTPILIVGYFGNQNLGDELLLERTISDLREIRPSMKIEVLSASPKETARLHQVKGVLKWNPFAVLGAIMRSRKVIFIGGLFQDVTSGLSLIYYAAIGVWAKLLFRKIVLYNIGVGPISGRLGLFLTRMVFAMASVVSLRDTAAARFFPQKQYPVTSDPLFVKPVNPSAVRLTGSLTIGVALKKYATVRYIPVLMNLILKLKSKYKVKMVYLPFEMPKKMKLLGDVCERFNIQIFSQITNLDTIYRAYNNIDFIIGMNYHALVVAIQKAVPFISINYDPKIENLVAPVLPETMINGNEMSERILKEKMIILFEKREEIHRRLVACAEKNRTESQRGYDLVKDFLLK